MRAAQSLRLVTSRGGRAPALLADPTRLDSIEIVDVEAGEAVLFWDCTPREATRLARRLRADLDGLTREEFLERWSHIVGGPGQ